MIFILLVFTSNGLQEKVWELNEAMYCKYLTYWESPRCRERLRAWGEGVTEDEVVGWHHWLNGHAFEHTRGDGDGQGSLTCCSLWGRKESDTTGQLNNKCGIQLSGRRIILLSGNKAGCTDRDRQSCLWGPGWQQPPLEKETASPCQHSRRPQGLHHMFSS